MSSRWVGVTPIWLSHHHASDADRCVRLGNVAVCRRCSVLYPVALLTVVAAAAGARWPESLDHRLLWLLPVPAVLDFLADLLGGRHRPRRQVLATVPLAMALGVGWLRLQDGFGDGLVWSVVATYGLACLLVVWATPRHSAVRPSDGVALEARAGHVHPDGR